MSYLIIHHLQMKNGYRKKVLMSPLQGTTYLERVHMLCGCITNIQTTWRSGRKLVSCVCTLVPPWLILCRPLSLLSFFYWPLHRLFFDYSFGTFKLFSQFLNQWVSETFSIFFLYNPPPEFILISFRCISFYIFIFY
jgi:hypothetical protein